MSSHSLNINQNLALYSTIYVQPVGRDSSFGIATRYLLEGSGIESRWGARFSAPVQTGHGAHPDSCTMDNGSFPGVKRPERGVNHPPLSSAEVKDRVQLYFYSSVLR